MAFPVSSSWPWASMSSLHFIRSCTPAKECMILSMQEWQGCQQPRRALLAALTMASQRREVISPCQSTRRGSEAAGGRESPSVIPLSRIISPRYSS